MTWNDWRENKLYRGLAYGFLFALLLWVGIACLVLLGMRLFG